MPKAMEEALKREATKMAKSGKLRKLGNQSMEEAKNAFIYGTMRKTGWKPRS